MNSPNSDPSTSCTSSPSTPIPYTCTYKLKLLFSSPTSNETKRNETYTSVHSTLESILCARLFLRLRHENNQQTDGEDRRGHRDVDFRDNAAGTMTMTRSSVSAFCAFEGMGTGTVLTSTGGVTSTLSDLESSF